MNNLSLQLQLLLILQKNKGIVSMSDLSNRLKCSVNTIMRRIDDINHTLLSNHELEVYKEKELGIMVRGQLDEIRKVSEILKENNHYTTWKNREERELLILLKLLSASSSKLIVLANFVHVTEATVLKDIKRLNLLFYPLLIASRQGSGTKFEGDFLYLQIKMMDFCYGILTPMNFIAISYDRGLSANEEIQVCSSELFINFVNNYIEIDEIIKKINSWEKELRINLSDIAFANLLLYIMIFEMRKLSSMMLYSTNKNESIDLKSSLLIDSDNLAEHTLLNNFLLGLDGELLFNVIQKNSPDRIDAIGEIVDEITELIQMNTLNISQDAKLLMSQSLLLLEFKYTNDFLYWSDELLSLYQGRLEKYQEFISQLQLLCNEHELEWLTLDSLLHVLDLFIEEIEFVPISVTLFCVAGMSTAIMMKKIIERYCPLLEVAKVCSLRNCSDDDLKASVILSTAPSEVLPPHAIVISSFFKEDDWQSIQEQVLNLVKTNQS